MNMIETGWRRHALSPNEVSAMVLRGLIGRASPSGLAKASANGRTPAENHAYYVRYRDANRAEGLNANGKPLKRHQHESQ